MASRTFNNGSDFNYYNGFVGDEPWDGTLSVIGSGGSGVTAPSGEGVPNKGGAVDINDDSSIPANVTSIASVQGLYTTQSTPSTAFSFIAFTFKTSSSLESSFSVTGSEEERTVTFSTDGGGVAWTRARVFANKYGGLSSEAPVAGGFTLVWSRLKIKVNFTLVAPTAVTGSATNVTPVGATLQGTINPSGGTSTFPTSYRFEYGLTSSYGSSTTLVTGQTGSSDIPASANISGLTGGTTYHFRVVSINDDHTVNGSDQTFTTTSTEDTVAFF